MPFLGGTGGTHSGSANASKVRVFEINHNSQSNYILINLSITNRIRDFRSMPKALQGYVENGMLFNNSDMQSEDD